MSEDNKALEKVAEKQASQVTNKLRDLTSNMPRVEVRAFSESNFAISFTGFLGSQVIDNLKGLGFQISGIHSKTKTTILLRHGDKDRSKVEDEIRNLKMHLSKLLSEIENDRSLFKNIKRSEREIPHPSQ